MPIPPTRPAAETLTRALAASLGEPAAVAWVQTTAVISHAIRSGLLDDTLDRPGRRPDSGPATTAWPRVRAAFAGAARAPDCAEPGPRHRCPRRFVRAAFIAGAKGPRAGSDAPVRRGAAARAELRPRLQRMGARHADHRSRLWN